MKTLKGWITTTFLAVTLMLSTMTVNAGIIFGGNLNQPSPCLPPGTDKVLTAPSDDIVGIIFGGLVGIIFGGGSLSQPVENCGIIFGGN